MSDEIIYLRCRNCGRLVPEEEVFARWYCSRECALQFTSCPNCGKYFEAGKGAGDFCSPDCAQIHPEGAAPQESLKPGLLKEKSE